MFNIIVTGANGFIGKSLTKALAVAGHMVIPVSGKDGNIALQETWSELPKSEIVIHLAAKAFVPDSWNNPFDFIETNTIGTLRALEYCRKNKAKLIFISSYLYGNPKSLPISETAEIFTPNPYALSKKTAETYCDFYFENYQVPTLIMRPFNIYGYGQSKDFLIPLLIDQTLNSKQIHVKDLEPKRDYLHIDDFIGAILQSLFISTHEIVNIGSGESYSVKEIIDLIQTICHTNYPITSEAVARKAEIMNTIADITKAKELFGWEPKLSFEKGLSEMINQTKVNLH